MSVSSKSPLRTISKLATGIALAMILAACSDSGSGSSQASNDGAVDPITTAAVEVPQASGSVDMDDVLAEGPLKDMYLGSPDAPVKLVEYMSLTCPHCAAFHRDTFKDIVTNYVDTGKVQFIVREFPFDPRGLAAAALARCAEEDKFFPMIDVLMQQQHVWARAENGRQALLDVAKLAGFTQETFESCLTNRELAEDVVAMKDRGFGFGVTSTPTFLINGKKYSGNMSVEQMSAIIDSFL